MKKVNYSAKIKVRAPIVWNALWDDENYKLWSSVFEPGSHAVTDWEEGSKVLFLSSTGEGMYSLIVKKIPNQLMSFQHMGVIKNREEKPLDEETRKWHGAKENYTLKERDGSTELSVDVDIVEEYFDFFNETFPKALGKVKEISER